MNSNTTQACKGCNGSGVQTNNDGLKVRCPICLGSGVMTVPSNLRDGGVRWRG